MKKFLIAGGIAAMLFASGGAVAHPGPGGPQFRGGNISRSDVIALVDQRFAKIDRNGDGRITRAELARAPKPDFKRPPRPARGDRRPPQLKIETLDRDRDGMISHAEFRAHAVDRFEKRQRNHERDGPGGQPNGHR